MAQPAANKTSTILEPKVFQAMVDALEPSRGLKLYNAVPKEKTPYPYAEWTVKHGRFSELAEYNVQNSEANLPARQAGHSRKTATLAYIREGDYFTPTATMYEKDLENTGNEAAMRNMEAVVAEQVANVNDRINNRIEWSLWQAIQGGINYLGKNTGPITVDYHFRTSHKVTLAAADMVDAGTSSVQSNIDWITQAKQLIQKDGGVPVTNVWLTQPTLDLIVKSWTTSAVSNANRTLLSDRMLDQYFTTGTLPGFLGVESWEVINQYYDVRSADEQSVTVQSYIPHGTVIFANMSANKPLRYVQGPTADFSAPSGFIGRFAKNWLAEDPSGRKFVIEESGLPLLDRPDQFATFKVASDTWANAQTWLS